MVDWLCSVRTRPIQCSPIYTCCLIPVVTVFIFILLKNVTYFEQLTIHQYGSQFYCQSPHFSTMLHKGAYKEFRSWDSECTVTATCYASLSAQNTPLREALEFEWKTSEDSSVIMLCPYVA